MKYLGRSISLCTIASGRQGAALSQAFGRVANHGLLLFLISRIVVVVATVSLVVHELALALGHVGEGRGVVHEGGVGQRSAVVGGLGLGGGGGQIEGEDGSNIRQLS